MDFFKLRFNLGQDQIRVGESHILLNIDDVDGDFYPSSAQFMLINYLFSFWIGRDQWTVPYSERNW